MVAKAHPARILYASDYPFHDLRIEISDILFADYDKGFNGKNGVFIIKTLTSIKNTSIIYNIIVERRVMKCHSYLYI